jgi:hypothetical protein
LRPELRSLGASGALWVFDAQCRRSILRLPDLRWTVVGTAPQTNCSGGPAPVSDSRFGLTAFEAKQGTIDVGTEGWSFRFPGSAPAFKPSGILTFVRNGRLYEWTVHCPPGDTAVRFQGLHALERCQRPVAGAPKGVREVVWLGEEEYAAVVGDNPTARLVFVHGSRSRGIFQSIGNRLGGLEASSTGRYVAARVDGFLELFGGDEPGVRPLPRGVSGGLSLAWSPDDRFAALATADFVYLFRTENPEESVRLKLSVSGLSWR